MITMTGFLLLPNTATYTRPVVHMSRELMVLLSIYTVYRQRVGTVDGSECGYEHTVSKYTSYSVILLGCVT